MDLTEWGLSFLQQRLQILLGALLGMETGRILVWGRAGAQLPPSCYQITFCLIDPLSGELLHTALFQ